MNKNRNFELTGAPEDTGEQTADKARSAVIF